MRMEMQMAKEVEIVNLTPHDITVIPEGKPELETTYPNFGVVTRVKETVKPAGEINEGIVLVKKSFGKIVDLPDGKGETMYIVSSFVLAALKAKKSRRTDILCPDTGMESAIRGNDGRIKGVRRLICL